jgi:hypothetical protein
VSGEAPVKPISSDGAAQQLLKTAGEPSDVQLGVRRRRNPRRGFGVRQDVSIGHNDMQFGFGSQRLPVSDKALDVLWMVTARVEVEEDDAGSHLVEHSAIRHWLLRSEAHQRGSTYGTARSDGSGATIRKERKIRGVPSKTIARGVSRNIARVS